MSQSVPVLCSWKLSSNFQNTRSAKESELESKRYIYLAIPKPTDYTRTHTLDYLVYGNS